MKQGIMTDDDTWGYLQYAAEIREQGVFFKPHLFWYIGYALFILGANSLIPGFEGIVIFQYIFAYIAMIAIYFTSINIFQNPKTALFTGLWFLGFFMISFWNLFIYAESLLISLYCISFYFLSKAYRGNLKTYQAIIAVFIFAWAILVKPTAIALLAAILTAGLYKLFTKYSLSFRLKREISSTHTQLTQLINSTQSTQLTNSFSLSPSSFNNPSSLRPLPLSSPLRAPFFILKSKIYKLKYLPQFGKFAKLVVLLTFLFSPFPFLILLNQMLSTFGIVEAYKNGEIVYNIHKMAHMDYAASLMIPVPDNLSLPEENWSPLAKMGYLWLFNPWYSIKLFSTKLFYYFLYIRPYYSWMHNALALAALLPMYYGFIKSMRSKSLKPELKIFALTLVAVSAFSVSLLTINWNSRFLMPILPLIFLIGAGGIAGKKTLDARQEI